MALNARAMMLVMGLCGGALSAAQLEGQQFVIPGRKHQQVLLSAVADQSNVRIVLLNAGWDDTTVRGQVSRMDVSTTPFQ